MLPFKTIFSGEYSKLQATFTNKYHHLTQVISVNKKFKQYRHSIKFKIEKNILLFKGKYFTPFYFPPPFDFVVSGQTCD